MSLEQTLAISTGLVGVALYVFSKLQRAGAIVCSYAQDFLQDHPPAIGFGSRAIKPIKSNHNKSRPCLSWSKRAGCFLSFLYNSNCRISITALYESQYTSFDGSPIPEPTCPWSLA